MCKCLSVLSGKGKQYGLMLAGALLATMMGPTGVGKTEIARRLAKLSGAPFVKVEATKFTEVGYVGRDVESMKKFVDLSEQEILALAISCSLRSTNFFMTIWNGTTIENTNR